MTVAVLTWVDPVVSTGELPIASIQLLDGAVVLGSVAPGVQTFTTQTLTAGAHTFTAVAVDSSGAKSVPSNAVSVTVPSAPPGPPTNLQAVLQSNIQATLVATSQP